MPEVPKPAALSPMANRVTQLVNELAGGNQRRFAAMVGISHAAISKIATGKTEPGGKILHLIACLPNINSEWLQRGTGSPFSEPKGNAPSVPITRALVPGNIAIDKRFLSGRALYLAASLCNETTYAVDAQFVLPARTFEEEKMRPNDLVVVDGNESLWRASPAKLNGRLVVLAKGDVAELHHISGVSDLSQGDLKIYTAIPAFRGSPDKKEGTPHRHIDERYPGDPPDDEVPDHCEAAPAPLVSAISLIEVVGIATQLIRIYN